MRNRLDLRKAQAGQILIFVTIVLALAAIIIPSFLTLTNAAHRSTEINKEKTQRLYAADTGVEDALQKMGNGNFTMGNYTVPGSVNGYNVAVGIEAIGNQSLYRITSTATDPLSGTRTYVVTDVPSYTLEITATTGGYTTPAVGNYTYLNNTSVNLVATAYTGYRFVNWTGNATLANPNLSNITINMNGNYGIKANFELESGSNWLYIIVNPPVGGNTNPTAGNHTYAAGARCNLTASPAACYGFVNWTGSMVNNPSDPNNAYITMNGNYTITANFTWKLYNLTLSANPPGAGWVRGNGTYYCGDIAAIGAAPAIGYNFVNWTGNGTVANPNLSNTTITMNGNYSIVANFASNSPCYSCWHYAIATFGGPGQNPFQNSGNINGDVYVNSPAGLQNAFVLNGKFYVNGDLTLQNAINVNGDVYVQGKLQMSNSQRIYGNAYATGDITLQNSAAITQSAYSQGSISLTNSSQIQGDAHYQGSISMSGASSVLGHLYHETVTLPPFPTFTPPTASQIDTMAAQYKNAALAGGTWYGDLNVNSDTSLGPEYITGSLTIKNNKTLTLTGTVYVEGTITLGNNAQIITGPGGPYAIVANGNIIISNNANVNAANTSPLPMIMSVNGSITVSGSSNIGGIIYDPRGTVTLSNSTNVYGSVVGLVVNTANSTVVTHAPELDSRQGLPSCGCGS